MDLPGLCPFPRPGMSLLPASPAEGPQHQQCPRPQSSLGAWTPLHWGRALIPHFIACIRDDPSQGLMTPPKMPHIGAACEETEVQRG